MTLPRDALISRRAEPIEARAARGAENRAAVAKLLRGLD